MRDDVVQRMVDKIRRDVHMSANDISQLTNELRVHREGQSMSRTMPSLKKQIELKDDEIAKIRRDLLKEKECRVRLEIAIEEMQPEIKRMSAAQRTIRDSVLPRLDLSLPQSSNLCVSILEAFALSNSADDLDNKVQALMDAYKRDGYQYTSSSKPEYDRLQNQLKEIQRDLDLVRRQASCSFSPKRTISR